MLAQSLIGWDKRCGWMPTLIFYLKVIWKVTKLNICILYAFRPHSLELSKKKRYHRVDVGNSLENRSNM